MPSLNFPGQVHLWKLSQFLQKGTEPTRETLLGDLALAAQFIVITARARIVGHFFSVKEAAKALMSGLLKLIDMVVGIPSLLAHNLENKVKEERCRYLVAELVCRVSFEFERFHVYKTNKCQLTAGIQRRSRLALQVREASDSTCDDGEV